MKISEIKSLSVAELNARVKELNMELFNLRFSNASRNLANPVQIRNVKREIARVKTVSREKELSSANGGYEGK